MAKAAGCAAKLNPATLDAVLRKLPHQTDPNVLVGFDTNDDAGIYLLAKNLALVQTVDFFTPIVDDPDTLRTNRRGQCAERRLRHGRPPDLRAIDRRLSGKRRPRNPRSKLCAAASRK